VPELPVEINRKISERNAARQCRLFGPARHLVQRSDMSGVEVKAEVGDARSM
jgi:hypothetical protein